MAILPNWPYELGLPLNSGYQHTLETVESTAMMAGVSRSRRNHEQPVSEFAISFRWRKEQLQQFRQFVRDEIDGAAGWFSMLLWSGGSIESHSVRIKTINQYQMELPYWSVSLTLECPARFRLSDDVGDVLLQWTADDLINVGNRLKTSLCAMGTNTGCFGGYSVIGLASQFNESLRYFCQTFNDWDTC